MLISPLPQGPAPCLAPPLSARPLLRHSACPGRPRSPRSVQTQTYSPAAFLFTCTKGIKMVSPATGQRGAGKPLTRMHSEPHTPLAGGSPADPNQKGKEKSSMPQEVLGSLHQAHQGAQPCTWTLHLPPPPLGKATATSSQACRTPQLLDAAAARPQGTNPSWCSCLAGSEQSQRISLAQGRWSRPAWQSLQSKRQPRPHTAGQLDKASGTAAPLSGLLGKVPRERCLARC